MAVGNVQGGQDRGGSADGGHEAVLLPDLLHGVKCCRAGGDRRHAAQPAGQDDHVGIGNVQIGDFHIRFKAHFVAALDDLAVQAHGGHGHPGPAQQVNGGHGFDLFKSGSQKYINHSFNPPNTLYNSGRSPRECPQWSAWPRPGRIERFSSRKNRRRHGRPPGRLPSKRCPAREYRPGCG